MENFLELLGTMDDQSVHTQVLVALRTFPNSKGKRFSIAMRMQALSEILSSGGLLGWVKPTDTDGIINVAENLYMAAGLEPMIEAESDIGFNKDKLLKKAFRLNVLP
ncbi:MAG: hypothetical protein ACJATK_002364 [Paracoccaceae bacterium]|jgi:hypothetical protein